MGRGKGKGFTATLRFRAHPALKKRLMRIVNRAAKDAGMDASELMRAWVAAGIAEMEARLFVAEQNARSRE